MLIIQKDHAKIIKGNTQTWISPSYLKPASKQNVKGKTFSQNVSLRVAQNHYYWQRCSWPNRYVYLRYTKLQYVFLNALAWENQVSSILTLDSTSRPKMMQKYPVGQAGFCGELLIEWFSMQRLFFQ